MDRQEALGLYKDFLRRFAPHNECPYVDSRGTEPCDYCQADALIREHIGGPLEHKVVKIARAIEADITDRSGLGDEWRSIDENTRREIRLEWARIIMEILS